MLDLIEDLKNESELANFIIIDEHLHTRLPVYRWVFLRIPSPHIIVFYNEKGYNPVCKIQTIFYQNLKKLMNLLFDPLWKIFAGNFSGDVGLSIELVRMESIWHLYPIKDWFLWIKGESINL